MRADVPSGRDGELHPALFAVILHFDHIAASLRQHVDQFADVNYADQAERTCAIECRAIQASTHKRTESERGGAGREETQYSIIYELTSVAIDDELFDRF